MVCCPRKQHPLAAHDIEAILSFSAPVKRIFCATGERVPATGLVSLGFNRGTTNLPRWRRNSIFGPGPRVPQDRNARARFLARSNETAFWYA